ncbi:BsuPI-related putative proteinase inhibitor [Shewanella abyssi]|uniref:BsuPI-related putative proteinase inhibitor n=1 Tax=Shewanella abyssi TaxID=311789 RepID=UPI00200F15B2|nr:BsuPI-related putative proteinase inhibitor [Shewanella abyssi]MCL1048143.1 BsuPI-related putative proteinase inhibitor [Shewanella abyssi]
MLYKAGLGLVVLSALGCSQGIDTSAVENADMTKSNNSSAKVTPVIVTPADKSDVKAKLSQQGLFDAKLIVEQTAAQPMKVTLQYTNNQSHGVPLMFNSGMTADLWLMDATGNKVWAWSNEMMFTQAIRETVMPAGKTQNVKFSIAADVASSVGKGYYLKAIFAGRATESKTPAMATVLYKF